MARIGKKTIENAVNVTEIFLKVLEYIDEDSNPTKRAEGMLAKDVNDNLIVLKTGAKRFNKLIKGNTRLLNMIARLPDLKEMTTEEVRLCLIKYRLIK